MHSGWVTICGENGVRRAARVSARQGHTVASLVQSLQARMCGELRAVYRGRILAPHQPLEPLLHTKPNQPHIYLFLVGPTRPSTPPLLQYDSETECSVCLDQVAAAVLLKECLHSCCAPCLRDHALLTTSGLVSCPMLDCKAVVSHRELRALLPPQDFEKILQRELSMVSLNNVFRCATPDCPMWVLVEEDAEGLQCQICDRYTCVKCRELHAAGEPCNDDPHPFPGIETMRCPCGALVTRAAGCDALTCIRCQTALCWATRGPRWGPGGHGDTTGGCRCKTKDRPRCHPSCSNCH